MKISADASLSYFSYFYLWRRWTKKYYFLHMHSLLYVFMELIVCFVLKMRLKKDE